MSNCRLKALIEGDYCCLFGYLQLCRARGQTPENMAEFQGVSPASIRYNYRMLGKKGHRCEGNQWCMAPLFSPPPLNSEGSHGGDGPVEHG